jgi:hypothetical protein
MCWPTIINVPADSSTIQGGINGSSNGDTVLVQPGTYVENINFNGHNIVLGSLFLTTGDTSYIAQTIIDGDSAASVVTFESGEDSTSFICGFAIINGLSARGGGILCRNNSDPTIMFNYIIDNGADFGAGICCRDNSEPLINNNSIIGNSAQFGGGIYCLESSPRIGNNILIGNISSIVGGGIYCINNGDPYIINNTISGNFASNLGGGIYCSNSIPVIINTIFWADSSGAGGYEISGTPTVTYSNIEGGWPGEGNIDTDPLFRNPSNGDFHLKSVACGDNANSPCIAAGDIYHVDSLLDCSWGLGTDLCDMGAYGGGDTATVGNRIINVPGDYPTIQQGIDATIDGDTVLVQPGTYVENINFNSHNIVLGSLFMTTGDTSYILATIIDGNSAATVVTFDHGESNMAEIAGFTIQNGICGIKCVVNSIPTIKNNIISNNYAYNYAGGIFSQGTSTLSGPYIIDNIISGNSQSGIYSNGRYAMIINNRIFDNAGRGIACDVGEVYIINNEIDSNGGAGISLNDIGDMDNSTINYNIISNNSNIYNGGGIAGLSAYNTTLLNNTITGNITAQYGGGIYGNFAEIKNTIVWDNFAGIDGDGIYATGSPNISYSDIQDTLWPGTGNISCDPMFCDPDAGNFHLSDSSCCVGAGQGGADIGALSAGCTAGCDYIVGDVNASGSYNGLDITYGVGFFKGGSEPMCDDCPLCPDWHYCGDVNGSCSYNGLDITYGVAYFKGGTDPVPCPDCPPVR